MTRIQNTNLSIDQIFSDKQTGKETNVKKKVVMPDVQLFPPEEFQENLRLDTRSFVFTLIHFNPGMRLEIRRILW